jgi:DNA-binding XRE family transcriptional regulator
LLLLKLKRHALSNITPKLDDKQFMEFNEKLQELRKQKQLTQEKLAESLYVSRTAISKMESSRGVLSIFDVFPISRAERKEFKKYGGYYD